MKTASCVVLCLALVACAGLPAFSAVRVHSFPFDEIPPDSPGWTMTGEWEYGPPLGLGGLTGDPVPSSSYDPSSPHTGDYVYGYDLSSDGHYETSISEQPLTTTALDCTGFVNVTLRFRRWLGVERATFDHASIQVSNNGTDWSLVWENPDYAPPPSGTTDSSWTQVEYDISAVADGQPTVYVRWVMGPTDSTWTWCGWNIDDVEILGDPATEILAWIPYTDLAWEYPNTLAALDSHYPYYWVTDSVALDATTLAAELVGKDVFLALEQELATSAQLATLGADFSDVLTEFVEQGGTVVVLLECALGEEGFLDATGLFSASYLVRSSPSVTLTVLDDSHPLVFGVGPTMSSTDAYAGYALGAGATPLLEDPSGYPVLAFRLLGKGAVVLLGFDYYAYNADTARLLANAVQYPRGTGNILLNQDGNDQYIAQQALDALGYSYTTVDASDFDTYLTTSYWGLVVVDMPANWPIAGYGELVNFLDAGGRAAISTWSLTTQPALCATFGVSAEETFTTPQPIYRWLPAHDLFTYPMDVPDLTTWDDEWFADADRLTWVSGSAELAAGFTASPTGGQAALVIADGIRILNGFLWDEANQDDDTDGVDDCVELVMNEIEFLRPGPRADFSASDTQCMPGQALDFTDLSDGSPVAWYWQFGDGETSIEQDPTHAYASTGSYTVTLTASDPYGQDTMTATGYITVGDPGVAAFSGSPTTGIAGMTVDFTDESTGGVTSWAWDFGDGGTATTQDPTHLYTEPGKYTVSLTATNAYGSDIETKAAYVMVGFPDTPPDLWAFEEVLDCVEAEIIGGYEDGNYYPDIPVDRAQMATYVARMLAGGDSSVPDGPATPTFNDVPDDFWAYKYIEYCVAEDIVQGYDAVTYVPTNVVTRDQMAVYMGRSIAGGDSLVPDGPGTATFDDVPIDHWAFKYVEYCVDNSVVQGYDATTYAPLVEVTRDQMAVYVSRTLPLL